MYFSNFGYEFDALWKTAHGNMFLAWTSTFISMKMFNQFVSELAVERLTRSRLRCLLPSSDCASIDLLSERIYILVAVKSSENVVAGSEEAPTNSAFMIKFSWMGGSVERPQRIIQLNKYTMCFLFNCSTTHSHYSFALSTSGMIEARGGTMLLVVMMLSKLCYAHNLAYIHSSRVQACSAQRHT